MLGGWTTAPVLLKVSCLGRDDTLISADDSSLSRQNFQPSEAFRAGALENATADKELEKLDLQAAIDA